MIVHNFSKIFHLTKNTIYFFQKEIKKIHEEIKEDYLFAVKKSIVDFVLKEPEIDADERFLDEDDETPLTIGKLYFQLLVVDCSSSRTVF